MKALGLGLSLLVALALAGCQGAGSPAAGAEPVEAATFWELGSGPLDEYMLDLTLDPSEPKAGQAFAVRLSPGMDDSGRLFEGTIQIRTAKSEEDTSGTWVDVPLAKPAADGVDPIYETKLTLPAGTHFIHVKPMRTHDAGKGELVLTDLSLEVK